MNWKDLWRMLRGKPSASIEHSVYMRDASFQMLVSAKLAKMHMQKVARLVDRIHAKTVPRP